MTSYERIIRQGRWLLARRRLLPVAVLAACLIAPLVSTPFLLVHGRVWLVAVSLILAFAGVALRTAAFVPRQRGQECQAFDPTAAGGVYSMMRFPVVASNLLLVASLVVYTGAGWFMIAAAMICLPCAYCVILAQEHSLQSRYGEAFLHWCRETYAISPSLFNWRPPCTTPGFLRTLPGQFPTVAMLMAGFCMIDLVKNLRVDFEFRVAVPWIAAFLLASLAALIFRRR